MKKDDYESNFPFSHRGKNIVYKFHPFSKKKEIDNVLKTSNSYTLFKEHRKPKHHIPTIVHGKRFQFQAEVNINIIKVTTDFKHLLEIF